MRVDRSLVERLERLSGTENLESVALLQALDPAWPAAALEVGGGVAAFTGPGMFVNRVNGLLLERLAEDDLARLEAFYAARGVPAEIEATSFTSPEALARLAARGYGLVGIRNLYAQALPSPHAGRSATVEVVTDSTFADWQESFALSEGPPDPARRAASDRWSAAAHRAVGAIDLIARVDGAPAANGSVVIRDGRARLGGMTTRPAFRRRGLQTALVRHRLALAHEAGASLAIVSAAPGSGSARNLERLGFTIGYLLLTLRLPRA